MVEVGSVVVATSVVDTVVVATVVVVVVVASVVVVVDAVVLEAAAEYFRHFELDSGLTAPMPSGRNHTSPQPVVCCMKNFRLVFTQMRV